MGDAGMLREVTEGLARPQPELSPKYFYDARGSALFERITELPEYYLTRAERRLLKEFIPEWVRTWAPAGLVELGAGTADKTRLVLDAMVRARPRVTYVPVDISGEFLEGVAAGLRADYPMVDVRPVVADLAVAFEPPEDLPRPALFAFLGSTIGNFTRDPAVRLLSRVRAAMRPGDRFLLGVDLKKAIDVLEAAYNDRAGVTAQFNLNVLRVLNRELGADFDMDAFRHHAFYDEQEGRIEMHLVAKHGTSATIPGAGEYSFAPGDSIRTEVSCKYEQGEVVAMFEAAGLRVVDWFSANEGFALVTGEGTAEIAETAETAEDAERP